VSDAAQIFEDAIRWLRDAYDDRPFFLERDVVYTVQLRLWEQIRAHSLNWSVFNDYPMIPGPRRHLSADLAIRSDGGDVLLAAEFKFEPAHSRPDLLSHKFPVIGWGDPLKDIARIREFVTGGKARVAYAVLIDEGRFFRVREAHPDSEWIDWDARTPDGQAVSILWARWPRG
jgi:hypothetical protein